VNIMSNKDLAIKAENISKRYRIGIKDQIHDSIGASILNILKSPINNYRKYRSLYKFNDIESENHQNPNSNQSDILWALRDISFEVKKGEVIGIIGRNGAGKSTLLKVLCRITDPTSGNAEIRGRISSLLEVGTGFHPELTGRENVYLNATILGMKKVEVDQKFDDIVEFSGIKKFVDTPVKRYSSGMTVRLAFSVAAHLEPEILLIDEVLAVGDADFQKKCLKKMEDVGQKGRTVLFVSHNMSAITRLCERVILLEKGHVIADGPSQKVVRSYLTSDSGSSAIREWRDLANAPSGDVARLLAVCVRSEDGKITESIDISKPVDIEMNYEVLKAGHVLMPHYHLYNEDGVEIFCAHDTDPAWRDRPRPKGQYKSLARIPGNLLSEGTFFVNPGLIALNPNIKQFYETAAVAFQVTESNGYSLARGGWAGPMTGAVRPLLDWQTECVSRDSAK
jgi:homopolymeric O-antigen transport system ATP-binding protein